MQDSSQQSTLREAPGGEMLASKSEGEPVRVGLELGQGLHPHTLSKSQAKKQRKLARSQPQQQSTQAPSQHYKEKAPAHQQEPTLAEGITQESAFEQRTQTLSSSESSAQGQTDQQQQQRAKDQTDQPRAQGQAEQKRAQESPILPVSSGDQKPSETTAAPSLEPPLLSPEEKSRQMQARMEVQKLEEQERQDRIERAKREDVQALARREASLLAADREKEAADREKEAAGREKKAQPSISAEEAEIMARRKAESEASLIGTVIDEEQERQRRIDEDYPTYTEPLEKTKALEEIEKRRRIYSLAEKARQQLAASASAKLFPNAPRPHLAESKLWTASGLLKRDTPLPSLEEKPRYSQFVTTTTQTTSSHLPHAGGKATQSSQPPSLVSSESRGVGSGPQLKCVETSSFAGDFHGGEQLVKSSTKVSKETYRSQSRPRLVVHHSGLSGKWQRHTETVELHEGVDY